MELYKHDALITLHFWRGPSRKFQHKIYKIFIYYDKHGRLLDKSDMRINTTEAELMNEMWLTFDKNTNLNVTMFQIPTRKRIKKKQKLSKIKKHTQINVDKKNFYPQSFCHLNYWFFMLVI